MDTNTNDNNENKKQLSYTDFFRNRFKKHDVAVKKIILQISTSSYRKKRNYQEAFAQDPVYTRFTDELEDALIS
jgi:hypothetical protein